MHFICIVLSVAMQQPVDCAAGLGNEQAVEWVHAHYFALMSDLLVRERRDRVAPTVVQLWSSHPSIHGDGYEFVLTAHVSTDGRVTATISRPKPCLLLEQFLLLKAADSKRDVGEVASRVELERRTLGGAELRQIKPLMKKVQRMAIPLSVRDGIQDYGSYTDLIVISSGSEEINCFLHGPSDHPLVRWADSVEKVIVPILTR